MRYLQLIIYMINSVLSLDEQKKIAVAAIELFRVSTVMNQ